MTDIRNTHLLSDRNYLKRSEFVGVANVPVGSYDTYSSILIPHNARTYVPFVFVAYDPDNSGTIWSGGKIDEFTGTSLTGISDPDPLLHAAVNEDNLRLYLHSNRYAAFSGTRAVYYIVYLDYQS